MITMLWFNQLLHFLQLTIPLQVLSRTPVWETLLYMIDEMEKLQEIIKDLKENTLQEYVARQTWTWMSYVSTKARCCAYIKQ